MKKLALFMLVVMMLAILTPVAFAADGPAVQGTNWVAISAGFGFAIAVAGCAYAQGKATAAACEGFARNPAAGGAIRLALILGLVFIESLSLYMFAIVYLKVK